MCAETARHPWTSDHFKSGAWPLKSTRPCTARDARGIAAASASPTPVAGRPRGAPKSAWARSRAFEVSSARGARVRSLPTQRLIGCRPSVQWARVRSQTLPAMASVASASAPTVAALGARAGSRAIANLSVRAERPRSGGEPAMGTTTAPPPRTNPPETAPPLRLRRAPDAATRDASASTSTRARPVAGADKTSDASISRASLACSRAPPPPPAPGSSARAGTAPSPTPSARPTASGRAGAPPARGSGKAGGRRTRRAPPLPTPRRVRPRMAPGEPKTRGRAQGEPGAAARQPQRLDLDEARGEAARRARCGRRASRSTRGNPRRRTQRRNPRGSAEAAANASAVRRRARRFHERARDSRVPSPTQSPPDSRVPLPNPPSLPSPPPAGGVFEQHERCGFALRRRRGAELDGARGLRRPVDDHV